YADGPAADVGGVGRAGNVHLQGGPGRQRYGLTRKCQHLTPLRAADGEGHRVAHGRVDRPEDVAARAGGQVILQFDASSVRITGVGNRDSEADRLTRGDATRVGDLGDSQVGLSADEVLDGVAAVVADAVGLAVQRHANDDEVGGGVAGDRAGGRRGKGHAG